MKFYSVWGFCIYPDFVWFLCLLYANPRYWFRHSNIPVFQSMSGFCSFSHGKPRMIFCFPNPVINSRVLVVLPWIVKFTSVKQVILPCLFSVPSMFRVIIGRLSDWVLSPIVFVKFWSMNFPPAPLSMRPRVSTVWFSSVHLIKMGIDTEFDLIVAKFTEKCPTQERSTLTSMWLSTLKTLFFSFLVEFFFLVFV